MFALCGISRARSQKGYCLVRFGLRAVTVMATSTAATTMTQPMEFVWPGSGGSRLDLKEAVKLTHLILPEVGA